MSTGSIPEPRGRHADAGHEVRGPRYRLTPGGKEYQHHLETVAALREGIEHPKTPAHPRLSVLWDGLLAGMAAGIIVLLAPVLWLVVVGHGSLAGIPWPVFIEFLSAPMLAAYALVALLIIERERRTFVSLFHVLDRKTAENTLLMRKLIASTGDGQRFRDLLDGVTTFLKDGSVDFTARKGLWNALTKSGELEVPLTNAMKEPDGGTFPPPTSPASEGQA